jgi:hypothetical protein
MSVPDALRPLAFLVGEWSGTGRGDYPTIDGFTFRHDLTVTNDGRPFLQSVSRAWVLDERGEATRPPAVEVGFWRPAPGGGAELLLVLPTGIAEVYAGRADGVRADVATHAVARTPTAKEVTAGRRVYALEGDELSYAHDMAGAGQPLQRHITSRLRRRGDGGTA